MTNREPLHACTSILVGKQTSADGSVMIGRNEDFRAAWPKHFVVHPTADIEDNKYVSNDTGVTVALPKHRFKYTATPEWTDKYGVIEEDGINEEGVAMSATESAYSNARVLGYDPYSEHGIVEESMITITLPYVTSAREGVQRLGSLIEKYGAGESDGVLFADSDEAWYMEIGSGHHWVAKRIPDDEYAVVANRISLQVIDFDDSDNYMYSTGLPTFAQTHHLWDGKRAFNWRDIFGTNDHFDQVYNTARVWSGQRILTPSVQQDPEDLNVPFSRKPDKPIFLDDVTTVLSDHFNHTIYDTTGKRPEAHKYRPISLSKTQESHVLQMRPNMPNEIANLHWLAMGVSAESIYVPFYAGITDTPADYKVGGQTYTDNSAYWLYKLAGVLVDAHYHKFIRDLNNVQKDVYSKFLGKIAATDQQALAESDDVRRAKLLTDASFAMADTARQAIKHFIADVITKETDLSPLTFTTDENL